MEQIEAFIHTYGINLVVGLLLAVLFLSLVQIHRTNVVRRQIRIMAGEVENYLDCVMADDRKKEKEMLQKKEREDQQRKSAQDEQQNRLISSVLEEIFS